VPLRTSQVVPSIGTPAFESLIRAPERTVRAVPDQLTSACAGTGGVGSPQDNPAILLVDLLDNATPDPGLQRTLPMFSRWSEPARPR